MTTSDLISIVIVNYNAGAWLPRCLDYIAQQTYPYWEVIIVDNASQDGSLALVENRDRVTIIRNRENRGFAAAQNQGIAIACGRYIMALNYDLIMVPDFLRSLCELGMLTLPQVGRQGSCLIWH